MRYNEDAVRMAMPSIQSKEPEREALKKQLDEWLAAGNIITVLDVGSTGMADEYGRKPITVVDRRRQ